MKYDSFDFTKCFQKREEQESFIFECIGTDMLTDFVSNVLARRALSKREQKQNKFLLFWAKAQHAKKALNVSLPIDWIVGFPCSPK